MTMAMTSLTKIRTIILTTENYAKIITIIIIKNVLTSDTIAKVLQGTLHIKL